MMSFLLSLCSSFATWRTVLLLMTIGRAVSPNCFLALNPETLKPEDSCSVALAAEQASNSSKSSSNIEAANVASSNVPEPPAQPDWVLGVMFHSQLPGDISTEHLRGSLRVCWASSRSTPSFRGCYAGPR